MRGEFKLGRKLWGYCRFSRYTRTLHIQKKTYSNVVIKVLLKVFLVVKILLLDYLFASGTPLGLQKVVPDASGTPFQKPMISGMLFERF